MITGIYAALCGVLLLVLSYRVIQRRLAAKVGLGAGGDAELEQRMRVQANFIEYVPLTLILLYLLEQSGAASVLIHTLGAVFVAARAWHAQGLSSSVGRTAGRFYGTLITLLVIAALSVLLLVRSIS